MSWVCEALQGGTVFCISVKDRSFFLRRFGIFFSVCEGVIWGRDLIFYYFFFPLYMYSPLAPHSILALGFLILLLALCLVFPRSNARTSFCFLHLSC